MPLGVFLFTDIEGSTRLWAEHPAEMGSTLARHDALLSDAVEQAGGEVFKHTGDGVAAVFPSASKAVHAAVTAQRSLAAHDWGPLRAIRVRMAIHAGEAESRDGDWFGPALNRVARLMGIGHGGQVLLSGAAHELVAEGSLNGFSFVDLGLHRLRDLTRAEHVWQLVGDGLERSFPPLRSFDGYRGQLPAQTTSFIGREAELAAISDEVASARLVTLVGPGGVGKTRLAIHVGVGLIDKFPDGVWTFELAGLNRPDGLEASMLATLGRSGTTFNNPRQALLDMVRAWRALLIVDNCEHLLRPVGQLVTDLLAAGVELTVLATSREPLHVPGERVVPVGPFQMANDALALFVDRATALRPSFIAKGESQESVVRICQQLDGVPLAIELAAARTIAMTPREIERRLDQRFRLLSARYGDEDRHSSLERVVEWSYDLLEEDSQGFFARLSVFSGSFDAQAAHAVCGSDDEFTTIGLLGELVDKSLVIATPLGARTSYRLLDTMRQYGAAHLTRGESERLLDRHGEYFADLAERSWDGMRGRESSDWLELLDDQFDNIRAACERALLGHDVDRAIRVTGGLSLYNRTRGLPEIYRWLEQALALPDAYQHRLNRHARLHRASAMWMNNDLETAETEIRAVLAERSDDSDPLKPLALVLLTESVGLLGRLDESEQLALETRECALRGGPDYEYEQADSLWDLCALAVFRGAPDLDLAHELLDLSRRLGNARATAGGLMMSGVAEPDPTRAAELLAEARELTARTRESYGHELATWWLDLLATADDPKAAVRTIPHRVAHARSTGQRQLLQGRDLLPPLAVLGRYDAVAVLDGYSAPYSIRPALAAEAVASARGALSEDEYAALYAQGKAFSPSDLEEFLLQLASELS